MTVAHHLDDATILRYAGGNLDEAFAVVVAAHLTFCPLCRQAVRDAEELGGQLLEAVETAELSAGSFDRLLETVGSSGEQIVFTPPSDKRRNTLAGDVPAPLRRFIGPSLDRVPWKRVAPGVRRHRIPLASSPASSLYMLYIGPGRAMPEHGHGGTELTLILSGAYRDAFGRFARGDIADLDEHIEHQPVVEPDAACICLVATEAPTRFKNFFSRLLQPLVGI